MLLLASLVLVAPQEAVHPFAAFVEERVPALQAEHGVPGVAVALIAEGELVWWRGYGTATAGEDAPITLDTGFNVGSVTKPFTAWGVLRLVEEGRVALDDPAFRHITRWKLPRSRHDADGVTLARLLSHTAGIHGDGLSDWKPDDVLPPIERSLSGVAGARPVRLRWEPGTRWSYANGGYALLQLLLIEVTGEEFESYMQAAVLDPLGLTRTSFSLTPEIVAGLATPHHPKDRPTWVVHRRVTSTGGLHTSLGDLVRFGQAFFDGGPDAPRGRGVLRPATVERMLAPAPAAAGAWGPGLALFELAPDARLAGHSGGAWGWGADLWLDPDRGNGYAAIANSTAAGEVLQPLFVAWKRWYPGSIPREVPDIPVDDAVRPFLGDWEGHIDTGDRELRSRWTLTEEGGLLRGTYTYSSGTESPLDVLVLDGQRLHAKVRRTPASYFHALEVSPDLVRGHYYEDKRHTFVLRRKRR